MNEQHSLISRKFFRCATDVPFVRHDLRVWESSAGRDPRLKDAAGKLLLGDALLQDWRARTARGAARVRAYYDVHPAADSALTLDPSKKNRWGDPLPQIRHALDEATKGRAAATREHILGVFTPRWRRPTTADGAATSARSATWIIRPAGAGWAPTPRRACATATAARTITRTCSSWDRRRCRPADARTRR